jgi:hypothetical protein
MKKALLFLCFIGAPWAMFELSTRPGFLPEKSKVLRKSVPSVASPITIQDTTEKTGLIFQHKAVNLPDQDIQHIQMWIVGTGAHVSVTDADQDGRPDVYVTSLMLGEPNRLFRNQGNGSFKDETPRFFKERSNMTYVSLKPLFFDCNNDGYQDLFQLTHECPKFYRNEAGRSFTDISKEADVKTCHGIYSNVVDFDNDGLLDIIVASYDIKGADKQFDSFFQGGMSGQFATLHRNEGNCRFKEVSSFKGVGLTHVVGVADTRGIGRKDIWFVTDIGTDKLFLDNGDGTYTDSRESMAWAYNRHGMSFDVLYEGDAEKPLIFVSHVYKPSYIVEGNSLWELGDEKNFKNVAPDRQVAYCGHAWGAKFFDLENDGDEDLVVTNGFFSQDPTKSYNFPMALLGTTHRGYMKQAKNWPAIKSASLYGYEKNCIFVREGEKFYPIAGENPLTSDTYDGRGVATLDINQDGTTTVLIANQRQPLKAFTIEQKNNNQWLGLKFQGSCSNRDAFGTKLRLTSNKGVQKRWYYPTNGFSAQTEASVIFGLGSEAQIQKLEVWWPGGHYEVFNDLKVNQYQTLVEGADCAKRVSKN